jgi:phage repressor protein C with HTH and peptisase S24 domain
MASIVTKRFVECHHELIVKGLVRSSRQFVLELGYSPQSWSQVIKKDRDVPVELIRKAIEKFNFNPGYIFSGYGIPIEEYKGANTPVLAIAVDKDDHERIVHVPVNAQAGYLDQFNDEIFIGDLPTFTLPGFEFKHGTFRAFEVSGDSMEPSIFQGEMVVCNYVDPDLWQYNIRNDYVYVIVTRGDVVIKRVQNKLKENGTLLLCSDNTFYDPQPISAQDIKEVWYVKMKISQFAHSKITNLINMEDRFDDMRTVISSQSNTIENLNQTIEKLLKKTRITQ